MSKPHAHDAIDRPSSLVEKVSGHLARHIRRAKEGGEGWLPTERALSVQLSVSRSVVREAAKRLESQGLIEIHHGLGLKAVNKLHRPLNGSLTILIPGEEERLRQLNETRLAVEPETAGLAAKNATLAQVRALQRLQRQLESAPDSESAIETDMAFHRAIATASGNHILRLILDSLADLGRASRQRTIGRVGKQTAVEHHAKILAAIERHDPAAAREAMRMHIVAAGEDMELRKSNPQKRRRGKRP